MEAVGNIEDQSVNDFLLACFDDDQAGVVWEHYWSAERQKSDWNYRHWS
jgi:hypothetical protein